MSSILSFPQKIQHQAEFNLVDVWLETASFGFNICLFGACSVVLLRKKLAWDSKFLGLFIITTLFSLATTHAILALRQLLAVIPLVRANQASTQYSDLRSNIDKWQFAKNALYLITSSIQNSILIWRAYVAFQRNIKLLGVMAVLEALRASTGLATLLLLKEGQSKLHVWSVLCWVLELCINISATTALAGRLWWLGRSAMDDSPISIWLCRGVNLHIRTIYTVIESGAIYTVAITVTAGLALARSTAAWIFVGLVMQLSVTSPLLIIVRMHFNFSSEEKSSYFQPSLSTIRFQTGGEVGMANTAQIHNCRPNHDFEQY